MDNLWLAARLREKTGAGVVLITIASAASWLRRARYLVSQPANGRGCGHQRGR